MVTWSDINANMTTAGNRSWGTNVPPLPQLIGRVINIGLGFIGLVVFIYAVTAGYKWMTAGGNETAIEEAKDTLKNAIFGILVIMSAYALTNFIMSQVLSTVSTGT